MSLWQGKTGTEAGPGTAPGPASAVSRLNARLGGHAGTQIVLFVVLIGIAGWLGHNMRTNMAAAGLTPGFAFLGHAANFGIGESLIPYSPADTFARAILVGLFNTLSVSVAGCILATVLGVALGIARLSSNPLLAGTVRGYIELIRNTPLLLQLFVWNGFLHALPAARQALIPLPGVLLSNRGIFLPALRFSSPVVLAVVLAGAALAIALAVALLRLPPARVRARTAARAGLAGLVVAGALALILLPGIAFIDLPALKGFNVRGGLSLTPEFTALLIGLVINASAGIAEIVRAGIQSVPRGQWEAGRAMGLSGGRIMRLIVLPQAVRVIIPVMTSSYLSLTKNSSLAVAIGYPDVVSILNTTANQTGQALEAILIMMGIYLSISLSVSWVMNRYNARLARQGRRT